MKGIDTKMQVEVESHPKFLRNKVGISDARDWCLSPQNTSLETSPMQNAIRLRLEYLSNLVNSLDRTVKSRYWETLTSVFL